MSIARRFLTGFRQTETNEPGLELNEDGTVDLVNPDGSRTALPGGSSPSVTVVAPITVNFNDVADESAHPSGYVWGYKLVALPVGTIVLRAWAFVMVPFLDIGGAQNGLTMNMALAKDSDLLGGWTLADYDADQRGADYTGVDNGTEEPSGSVWPLVGWTEAVDGALVLMFAGTPAQVDLVSGRAICGAVLLAT